MKKLTLILFFILTLFNVKAQMSDGLKTSLLFTSHIVLNAMGDAYNDEGMKTLGHSLNAMGIASLLTIPLIVDVEKDKWYLYLISYTTLRIGLFDPTYNTVRGLGFNYVGTSSISDKVIQSLNSPNGLGYLGRGTFFIVGFYIPINHL